MTFNFSLNKKYTKFNVTIISILQHTLDEKGNLISTQVVKSFMGKKKQLDEEKEQQKLKIQKEEDIIL